MECGEKRETGAARFLFEIARGQSCFGPEKGQSELGGETGDETLVFVGGFGAPFVIEMGDARERIRSQFAQDVQETHGIRTAGHSGDHAGALRQHVITRNGFEHARQHG